MDKKTLLVTIFLVVLAIGGGIYAFTTKQSPTSSATITPTATEKMEELKIEDIVVGTGAEAVAGKKVTVHYTGTLTDGTKFDSSVDRGTPFIFSLGAGEVIAGWDQGVAGMKAGGKTSFSEGLLRRVRHSATTLKTPGRA